MVRMSRSRSLSASTLRVAVSSMTCPTATPGGSSDNGRRTTWKLSAPPCCAVNTAESPETPPTTSVLETVDIDKENVDMKKV